MRNTHRVQILHAVQDLFERAFDLTDAHVALLDGSIEVSARTIFHDFAPMMLFVLNEIYRLDDVGMVERRGDAKLGGEFLDVFLFRLVLSTLSEFL